MCFIHKLRQSIPYQQAKIETDMGLGRWFRWQRAYEELNSVPRMHIFLKKKKVELGEVGKKSSMVVYVYMFVLLALGRQNWQNPGVHWLTSLALSVNSRPVRDHISKERQRKMYDTWETIPWLCSDCTQVYMHTYKYNCLYTPHHIHTHLHKHIQTHTLILLHTQKESVHRNEWSRAEYKLGENNLKGSN